MLPHIRNEAFREARERLGLSVRDLSTKTCFSMRQIEHIENGEISSFYAIKIKLAAAKKVAAILELKDEDAFDFGTLQQVVLPQIQAEIIPQPNNIDTIKAVELMPNKKQGIEKNLLLDKYILDRSKSSRIQLTLIQLFLLISTLLTIFISMTYLSHPYFIEAPKEEVIAIVEPPNEAITAENSRASGLLSDTQALTSLENPVLITPLNCPVMDLAIVNFKPENPKKLGNMIYVQPKTDQVLCIIDATGISQNKSLEAGVGMSIFGKPPFKVLTVGLDQVDLYYQGAKVRTISPNTKTLVLEQADLNPSLTITDSGLR